MADGALNVTLSDDHGDFTWPSSDPRQDHARNHDLNEPGRAWSEVRPELLARMERSLTLR